MPSERSVNQRRSPRVIVAAVIITDGRVLACERSAPPEVAGRWEFPGGKVEPGESDQQALARECAEELGVRVEEPRLLRTQRILEGGNNPLFHCLVPAAQWWDDIGYT